jgi:hypothetical protein
MKILKSTEAFFNVENEKFKTIVSKFSDGTITLTQEDGHEIILYPTEIQAVIEVNTKAKTKGGEPKKEATEQWREVFAILRGKNEEEVDLHHSSAREIALIKISKSIVEKFGDKK